MAKCNDDMISKLDDQVAIEECQECILDLEREKYRIMMTCVLKQGQAPQSKDMVVKKLDPPRFSGNVKTSVKHFNKLMVSQCSKDVYNV